MHTFANAGKGMILVKLYKSLKEKEVFYYFNTKEEKLWLYRYKYYDDAGKRKEKKKSGFKTEKAAIKALLEVKAQSLRGETKAIENDNLTVAQWLDIWYEMNHKKWKPATSTQRESFIRLQLKPLIGHVKLNKLDKLIYQRLFLDKLEGKYKPSTIRSLHVIMRTAINAAIEEEILLRNKLAGAILPTKREGISDNNYLSPDELNVFLKTVEDNEDITHSTLFHLLAYTGMRKGEALGLQWNNIDFDNRTIEIIKHRGLHGIGSTKTKNSERTIKVDEIVIAQLKTYQKALKQLLLKHGQKLTPSTFIFLSLSSGEPLSPTGVNANFNRMIAMADLPKTTIHGLRHSHATVLLNNDVLPNVIAKRLGNTVEMINTVYGHILKELEDKTVNVFSTSLQQSGAKSGASS